MPYTTILYVQRIRPDPCRLHDCCLGLCEPLWALLSWLFFSLPGRPFFLSSLWAFEPITPALDACPSLYPSGDLWSSGSRSAYLCKHAVLLSKLTPLCTILNIKILFYSVPCFLVKQKICLEVPNTTKGKILYGSFLLISFSVSSPESNSILEPFCGWNTFLFVCVVFDFYGYLPTHDQGGYILLNT